jgi:hypothetical protein
MGHVVRMVGARLHRILFTIFPYKSADVVFFWGAGIEGLLLALLLPVHQVGKVLPFLVDGDGVGLAEVGLAYRLLLHGAASRPRSRVQEMGWGARNVKNGDLFPAAARRLSRKRQPRNGTEKAATYVSGEAMPKERKTDETEVEDWTR